MAGFFEHGKAEHVDLLVAGRLFEIARRNHYLPVPIDAHPAAGSLPRVLRFAWRYHADVEVRWLFSSGSVPWFIDCLLYQARGSSRILQGPRHRFDASDTCNCDHLRRLRKRLSVPRRAKIAKRHCTPLANCSYVNHCTDSNKKTLVYCMRGKKKDHLCILHSKSKLIRHWWLRCTHKDQLSICSLF